jgi:hypothetical protein
MADKKISQLSNASTPVAGTETLPIVQSGSTVKVSIANLTSGRSVDMATSLVGLGAAATPSYTINGDPNTGAFSPGADIWGWSTGGTERGRFNAAGYLKVSNAGTYDSTTGSYHEMRQTANGTSLLLTNIASGYTGANFYSGVFVTAAGTGFDHILCVNSLAATVFQVRGDGNAYNVNGVYSTVSDANLKQDIVDAGSQWDDIKAIRFRKYRLKAAVEADASAPAMLGVVAQELEQVSPGLVEELETHDHEGNVTGSNKTVKTSILLMKSAVALQEAMLRIEALEAEVAKLKS